MARPDYDDSIIGESEKVTGSNLHEIDELSDTNLVYKYWGE